MRSAEETLVVPHHQLAVDLLHRLQSDANRDEERGATERELTDVPEREDQQRHDRDRGQEKRAGERDADEDPGQLLLGLRTGADAGNEPTLLADDVRLLLGV